MGILGMTHALVFGSPRFLVPGFSYVVRPDTTRKPPLAGQLGGKTCRRLSGFAVI